MYFGPQGSYNGYWCNGKRHGEGIFTYPNGDTYSGWWKYGDKGGTGTYTFKESGMKLTGEWEGGAMCTGRWIYPNGLYYTGTFKNNKPDGKGEWKFAKGGVLCGEYQTEEKKLDEDDPDFDPEKPAMKILKWNPESNITTNAMHVNSVLDSEKMAAKANIEIVKEKPDEEKEVAQ